MKKLKLDLDRIAVDSFDAAGTKGGAGTLLAHSYTYQSGDQCYTGLQDSCYSCPAPPYCNPMPVTTYC